MYACIIFNISVILKLSNYLLFIYRVAEVVVDEGEKNLSAEKPTGENDAAVDGEKKAEKTEVEEKEPEDKVNKRYDGICCFQLF